MAQSAELLVVGYDLDAESEVHIGDRTLPEWHAIGYKGTRRLVCYLCWPGFDAAPGTEVALVPRGRLGGTKRAHFAHPPGAGVHRSRSARETIWHLAMKHRLAGWAAGLSNVASAVPERWTPDGKRRADVFVLLDDGSRLALEVQSRIITDRDWVNRHADYAANSIQDIWFMRSGAATPYGLHELGVQAFTVHNDTEIAVQLARAHDRTGNWWDGDLDTLTLHYPPCAGDPIEHLRLPLDTLGLDRNGPGTATIGLGGRANDPPRTSQATGQAVMDTDPSVHRRHGVCPLRRADGRADSLAQLLWRAPDETPSPMHRVRQAERRAMPMP
jgi:hypothetical protein